METGYQAVDEMKKIYLTGVAASLFLAACGGDSSSAVSIPASAITPAANTAPIVSLVNNDKPATVGEAFSYDATQGGGTFSDADNDLLTYTVSYSPSAHGLSDSGGVISGTPNLDGTVSVTVTANDGNGGSVSDNFHIIISPAGTDQNAVVAQFAGRIDLDNLENYQNQTSPDYITKLSVNGNPITDEGATLGRVLFYDPALSFDDTISCSSCHMQEAGFSDLATVSAGVDGAVTERHSMRLINTQFTDATNYFWDNRASSLEDQTSQPIISHVEHGFSGVNGRPTLDDLFTKLEAIEYYQELFTYVYGDAEVTEERLQLALAQFTKSIWSFDSKYDAGRAQVTDDFEDFPNFTTEENLGKILYLDGPVDGGAGCQRCHLAPEFDISPLSLHNGVVAVAGAPGEFDFTNVRSPSLRDMVGPNGESNGPFMHDGSQPDLGAVVDHYNVIPVPTNAAARQEFLATIDPLLFDENGDVERLNLNQAQRQQLIAFLRTLSGTSVYTDTKYSDPF